MGVWRVRRLLLTLQDRPDLDGVGENVQAALEAAAGLFVESNDLCHGLVSSLPDVVHFTWICTESASARFGRPLALTMCECQVPFWHSP